MTTYIQTPVTLKKAQWLIENAGAVNMKPVGPFLSDDEHVLVCVVENGPFDAAAIVEDQRDFLAFSDPMDVRYRTWLRMDRMVAFNLTR